MERNKVHIRKLKEKLKGGKKDYKENKSILKRKRKKDNKFQKRLKRDTKIRSCDVNKKGGISRKRRVKIALLLSSSVFIALIFSIVVIQFVQGDTLKGMAYLQQTLDRKINPKRGTIYDATGTVLAQSSTVETVTVNPGNISAENKEKVAKKLAEIFELDYEKVLKKVSKRKNKKVEEGK